MKPTDTRIMSSVKLYALVCFLAVFAMLAGSLPVKIVEGIDKWSTDPVVTTPHTDSAFTTPAPSVDPFSGTINLSFLQGSCFSSTQDRFEYTLCPFQNVTSKRIMGQKTNLLGVWGNWQASNDDRPSTMTYVDGQPCTDENVMGGENKEITPGQLTVTSVEIVCNHTKPIESVSILSVEEKSICSYHVRLGVPIACSLLSV